MPDQNMYLPPRRKKRRFRALFRVLGLILVIASALSLYRFPREKLFSPAPQQVSTLADYLEAEDGALVAVTFDTLRATGFRDSREGTFVYGEIDDQYLIVRLRSGELTEGSTLHDVTVIGRKRNDQTTSDRIKQGISSQLNWSTTGVESYFLSSVLDEEIFSPAPYRLAFGLALLALLSGLIGLFSK